MAYTSNKEGEELILSRLADLLRRCERSDRPCYLGFLDDFQQKVCADALRKTSLCRRFYGGYEDAERKFLCVSPEEPADEDFPIACVEAVFRPEDGLTHRDFLGSVLGLDLKREAVGDIVVEPGVAHLFLSLPAKNLVLMELQKVGRCGVSCREAALGGCFQRSFEEVAGSVSSLRLDCVTAFLANLSRTAASSLVSSGQVSLDGQPATDAVRQVAEGEKISIRGCGKFIFDEQMGTSKKGKLRVRFRKYS